MKPLPPLGLEHLSTALLVLDRDFRVRYANPAAENLFEFSSKSIAGTPITQLFPETGGLIAATEAAFASGASYTEHELVLATTAHTYHVSLTVSPVVENTQLLLLEFHQIDKHLKIARGEARESKGRYNRMKFLLPTETITKRVAILDRIIGGLTATINTIESKRTK